MEDQKPKIKFKKNTSSFYKELNDCVQQQLTEQVMQQAYRLIKWKCIVYSVLFLCFYANLYNPMLQQHFWLLAANYTLLGLSGILLAFNCAHDAVHHTFSHNKRLNRVLFYLIFSLQGVNAALWRKRHIASHHIFPNVDGCDADIDNNPFLRLSETHPLKPQHRYQHLFAPLLYCLYTLHWILIKDIIYLRRKEVANLRNQTFSGSFVTTLILLKLGYFAFMIGLPCLFTPLTLGQVLPAFLIMHGVISLFFVFTLIISHLSMETAFPVVDPEGNLPFDYYEHQLSVSLDYHPESKLANWIFGGFNAHAAHHLFPKYPHTVYALITPSIQAKAAAHDLSYHRLPMHRAIRSHFRYLKRMGQKH
ncbi:hypothetical protein DBR32_00435 [Taibaiella sp. KBW10]|uniref:fatty acid desaturase family protein n=1 Tax=Taibaiella sp. KBW10 TaxID=2153357 RepID=UPI000F5B045E|nr:acyl-CoA desaturase [Taibaiella sp. KBW10]RQO32116.1 hypothetical protein DBR32_00435 [Taibaiella sp. KBW10]